MEIRTSFHKYMNLIQDEVLELGSMVEKAISSSMEALKNRNLEQAKKVVEDDKKINQKRYEIEEKCIQLIATQQPMAGDLRKIICIFSIVSELERIGDYAEGTARIAVMIGDEPPLKPLIDLPRMADKTVEMLHRSLLAFINNDDQEARKIIDEDDEIDALYEQVSRELLTFMLADPRTITRATRLIWVDHNLERSADRVTNICERIIYVITGKLEDLNVSKY